MRTFSRVALFIAVSLLLAAGVWAADAGSTTMPAGSEGIRPSASDGAAAAMPSGSQPSMAGSSGAGMPGMPGGSGAAGPRGGMGGGMMGGGMMGMMSPPPAIAVDANSVYVVSGSTIYKYDKNTLQLIAQSPIPAPGASTTAMQPQPSAPATSGAAGTAMPAFTSQNPETQQMLTKMQAMQPRQFETSFLEQMQARTRGAVALSRLAATRAQHPELRTFAQTASRSQGNELAQYAQWQMDWYGSSTRIRPVQADQDALAKLRTLQAADFDRAYIEAMVSNYTDQSDMAKLAATKAEHREVRATASTTMQDRTADLNQLCTWLSSWYGTKS